MARLLLALSFVPLALVACGDKDGTDPDAYPEANCNDALDNDEDGATDCDDDDCVEAPACDGTEPDPDPELLRRRHRRRRRRRHGLRRQRLRHHLRALHLAQGHGHERPLRLRRPDRGV
jgi:hypothetical protein